MKLYNWRDVVPDGTGRVYRQSRTMGVISAVIFSAIFGGAPIFWGIVGAPGFVQGLCWVVALLVVPLVVGDMRIRFRPTNWVVWLRPDCVYVNFRSYQDKSTDDAECVVRLEYAEIAEASQHVHKYTTPGSDGGSTAYSVKSLDLRLAHDRSDEVAAALSAYRRHPGTTTTRFGIGVTSRPSHFAVSLPEPDLIRIAWRGGVGSWVAPSSADAVRELSGYVSTGETVVEREPGWRDLSDDELDERILSLVQAGSKFDAIRLLVRRRGYTLTEAHRFVDELLAAA